jgi:hypothetical protein
MEIKLHQEPNHVQSEFIRHALGRDATDISESADVPKLSYLRVELIRLRPGMSDFLMRVSTPVYKNNVNSNTVVTLRCNRAHGNMKGASKISELLATEMKKRSDNTHKWDALNAPHLAKMLVGPLQFFTRFNSSEELRFTTEALL